MLPHTARIADKWTVHLKNFLCHENFTQKVEHLLPLTKIREKEEASKTVKKHIVELVITRRALT